MDLRAKLSRLMSPAPKTTGRVLTTTEEEPTSVAPSEESQSERLAELKRRLAEMTARGPRVSPRIYRGRSSPELKGLPGTDEHTASGSVRVVLDHRSLSYRHGAAPIALGRSADSKALAVLACNPVLTGIDASRLLYLDTETTGLAGGTGTLAFLVGLGWFEGDAFVVEQLLLTRPGDETPLLTRLVERLKVASGIVTFNGRAFDWPLLCTRFVMNRMQAPSPVHIDLLHMVRRIYRQRLLSLRLKAIEADVLGLMREGDIDGAEIPPIYWQFLRSGDGSQLEPILGHNVQDILALPAILGSLARDFSYPSAHLDPRDALGFAHLVERQGDTQRAIAFADIAVLGSADVVVRARWLVARIELRRHNYGAAMVALKEALPHARRDGNAIAHLHLGLAKLFEHRLHDLSQALLHAEHTADAEGVAAQAKRVHRLLRRHARIEALERRRGDEHE